MMEIKFKRDTSFRKQFFVPESFAHPAKMDAQLLLWIVERYTKEGETILDPMAGSGTTMLACTVSRNVVLVELEEKFCKMMAANWEQVKMRPQLGSGMGSCQIIQGDARQLEGLVDKIVTSPPYAETLQGSGADAARKRISEGKYKGLRPDVWTSKGNIAGSTFGDGYSRDPDNIGSLPYGQIDSIVTSPPYSDEPTISESYLKIRREIGRDTSKPSQRYRKYDSIITSPPYEGIESRDRSIESSFREGQDGIPKRGDVSLSVGYSENSANIGNLKSASYLEAMALVYAQCHKVLKPGGLLILVTKNFLRDQKEIRLDSDTIALCEKSGFQFVERHYRKLPSQSFWRVIYAKKYPDAPVLDNEDVLVFAK